jgi:hypothetical protein
LPADVALTLSVAVPEPPLIVVADSEAVNPLVPVADNVTVPANPLIGLTVIVDEPFAPALIVTLVGLALILKSWTVYVTVVVLV